MRNSSPTADRALGQSAGRHNDPLSQLQQVSNENNENTENNSEDGGVTTDNSNAAADESAEESNAADSNGAEAAGGGAGRIKPILPTFAGEGNNIFEKSSLAQEIIDSFVGYCQHARIVQDKRLDNLDQCLTGVAKKWYRTETKFVGPFPDRNAFETKFADCFGIELTPNARGTQAETLYIRDGELCRNFIDRCRLYQYKVSQQTKQTIAQALPDSTTCDTCATCPTREVKIKRITDVVLQRECIFLSSSRTGGKDEDVRGSQKAVRRQVI